MKLSNVTGTVREFGSLTEVEVPCYLPRYFLASEPDLLQGTLFIADRGSFCYRKNSSLK